MDLSSLSNEQLMALHKGGAQPSFAAMSDDDLKKAYEASKPQGMMKALDAGVARGVAGIAGLPGDVTDLGAKGIEAATNFVTDKLGMERAAPPDRSKSILNAIPTSESVKKTIERDMYGGEKLYEPKTRGEKYASGIGEFALGLVGGGGLMQLGKRALTQVAAPAVASEAAGQVTEGTAAEPYARVSAALLAGPAASSVANRLTAPAKIAAPTQDALEAAKTAAYNDPAVKNLRISSQSMSDFSDDMRKSLLTNKVDEAVAPTVTGILDRLKKARFDPNAHTIDDLDLARQSLSSVPHEERRAAAIVREGIDKYLGNIPTEDVVAGNATNANAKILEARANTAALKRDETITAALGRADNQAASAHSGGNLENATRQSLRPILNEKEGFSKAKRTFQDYTPEELAALKKSVVGTWTGNRVREVGKLLGGGGGLGSLAAGSVAGGTAATSGSDPLSSLGIGLAAMAGGKGLNAIGNRMAAQRAQAVSELLRSRSPLHQANIAAAPASNTIPADPKRAALISALLAAQQQQYAGQ